MPQMIGSAAKSRKIKILLLFQAHRVIINPYRNDSSGFKWNQAT
jgi:hypothetical protein